MKKPTPYAYLLLALALSPALLVLAVAAPAFAAGWICARSGAMLFEEEKQP
jgi:hypothetical protein